MSGSSNRGRLSMFGRAWVAGLVVLLAVLGIAGVARAETPGKIDSEAAEMAAELIGAPVFAADGPEVGQVADILFGEDNEPRTLRVSAAQHLGLGIRVVEVPKGAFMLLRGAAVLELPAAAVKALPAAGRDSGD